MLIPAAKRLQQVEEYYFSIKLKEIRAMRAKGHDVVNIGIGSPDLAPAPQAIQALLETATRSDVHGYQSYVGIPELRQAMSEWYQQTYSVTHQADGEVLPLMGSKEGIMHISMTFLNAGDGVLVPNPGYLTYSSVSRLLNAKIHTYELDEANNWEPNWQQLGKLASQNIKLMWVNYPNMPTGANSSLSLFEKLIAFGKKNNILIINDNPYSLILNKQPQSIFQCADAKEVALELNSLSKSHNMAGWRVGMVTGRSDYLQNILKVKSNMDSGMFLGVQKAAIQALRHTPPEWHHQQNDIYRQRRALAWQIMDTLNCIYDKKQVGLFVWAKIPDHIADVKQWIDKILHQKHVFITPGFIFGSAGERYIRASLCAPKERLQEALDRIIKM